MNMSEQVAFLRGLAEGMEVDAEKKEGKLFFAVLDALEAAAAELSALRSENETLSEALEAVNADLEDVEDVVFGDSDTPDGEGEECYATTCPACQETIYFDETVLEEGGVVCPSCGEKLEFLTEEEDAAPSAAPDAEAAETLEDCGEE